MQCGKRVLFKKISDTVTAVNDVININIIRNVACCIISAVIVLFNRRTNIFSMRPFEIVICLISGISMTLFLLGWTFAIKTDAIYARKLPAPRQVLRGFLCSTKPSHHLRCCPFAAIIAALYFLFRYNFSIKGRLTKKQIVLLALILFSQGINQTVQKLYMVLVAAKKCRRIYAVFLCIYCSGSYSLKSTYQCGRRKSTERRCSQKQPRSDSGDVRPVCSVRHFFRRLRRHALTQLFCIR